MQLNAEKSMTININIIIQQAIGRNINLVHSILLDFMYSYEDQNELLHISQSYHNSDHHGSLNNHSTTNLYYALLLQKHVVFHHQNSANRSNLYCKRIPLHQ